MRRQFLDGEWIDTSEWPREITPPDQRWRDNPYWKFTDDIDPSEIDAWNEARLWNRPLDGETCRRLCRYFLIFAENLTATNWWLKRDPIKRAKYLYAMAPIVAEARKAAERAAKREDVDRLYDFLGGNGIDPV